MTDFETVSVDMHSDTTHLENAVDGGCTLVTNHCNVSRYLDNVFLNAQRGNWRPQFGFETSKEAIAALIQEEGGTVEVEIHLPVDLEID